MGEVFVKQFFIHWHFGNARGTNIHDMNCLRHTQYILQTHFVKPIKK